MAEKNIKNTHPGTPPEPGSIVNNQSSITNREIPCSPDPLMPLSPLVSSPPVSCLLSSPFYLLPKPPISPILPLVLLVPCPLCSSTLCASVPLWLQVNYAKQTQSPQAQNQRNHLCHKDLRHHSAPLRPQKTNPNKPKQTQLVVYWFSVNRTNSVYG